VETNREGQKKRRKRSTNFEIVAKKSLKRGGGKGRTVQGLKSSILTNKNLVGVGGGYGWERNWSLEIRESNLVPISAGEEKSDPPRKEETNSWQG